jgi:hypothetical protein
LIARIKGFGITIVLLLFPYRLVRVLFLAYGSSRGSGMGLRKLVFVSVVIVKS